MFIAHSPFTPNQQRLAEHLREAHRNGLLDFEADPRHCTNRYGAIGAITRVCMAYTAQHPVKFGRGRVTEYDYSVVAQWIFEDAIQKQLALYR